MSEPTEPTDPDAPKAPDSHDEGAESGAEAGPATERPAPGESPEQGHALEGAEGDAASPADVDVPLSPDPSAFGPDDDFLDRTTPGMRTAEVIEAVYRADAEVTVNLTGDVIEPPDPEMTVNLTGELFDVPLRDDLGPDEGEAGGEGDDAGDSDAPTPMDATGVARAHLKGLIEALVFASDAPVKTGDLAKSASAQAKEVKEVLVQLKSEYASRGLQLDEVAGGWIFRTNAAYAPFVRDLTKQKPVKLTRAQIETLAILAYRQPITRPEIDEIRGVDSGPVLKMLLERDLVRILGKKDEPGRPLLYGTTPHFLEFFGLKSLKDLPTLREFTELNEDSRRVVEKELGETLETAQAAEVGAAERDLGPQTDRPPEPSDSVTDTIRPASLDDVLAADEEPATAADDAARDPDASDPPAASDASDAAPASSPDGERPVIAADEEEFPDDEDDAFDEDEDDEDEDNEDEDKDDEDEKDEKP